MSKSLKVEFARVEVHHASFLGEQCQRRTVIVGGLRRNHNLAVGFPQVMQLVIGEALDKRQLIGSAHQQTCRCSHAIKLGIGLILGLNNPVFHALFALVGVEGHVIGVSIGKRGKQFILLDGIVGPSLLDIGAPDEIVDSGRIYGATILAGVAHLVPAQRNDVATIGSSEVLNSTRNIGTDIDSHLFTLQALARLVVRDGLVGVVTHVIRFINIDYTRAWNDMLNAAHNGTVTQDVDALQVGGQRIAVECSIGGCQGDFGTQSGLLIGNNADAGCGRCRGFGAELNAEVIHREAVLVGFADGMDGNVILASLIHREQALVFLAHVVIGGDIGGFNDRGGQGVCCGLGAQQHLKSLVNACITGIDNHIIVLACLELNGQRDKVVIGVIVNTVIVIGQIVIND